jgi:hypothetical protein
MSEVWKAIPNFGGLYQVSDLGRVRSLSKFARRDGILSQHNCSGYLRVSLYRPKEDRPKLYLVHRLVLSTFIGACPDGMEALHINGDSGNNHLSNLRWATRSENVKDILAHGRFREAMDRRRALTDEEASFVRANSKHIKQNDLASMFGVHRDTIRRIQSGERYA